MARLLTFCLFTLALWGFTSACIGSAKGGPCFDKVCDVNGKNLTDCAEYNATCSSDAWSFLVDGDDVNIIFCESNDSPSDPVAFSTQTACQLTSSDGTTATNSCRKGRTCSSDPIIFNNGTTTYTAVFCKKTKQRIDVFKLLGIGKEDVYGNSSEEEGSGDV